MTTVNQQHLVIVTDIFGLTPAINELIASLDLGYLVSIVDPYADQFIAFKDEQLAYQYFTDNVGLETYIAKLKAHIQGLDGQVYLLGFSVGASAIWAIAEDKQLRKIQQAWLFYGSQVRYYQHITPIFPMTLYLPHSEPHFSVAEMAVNLKHKSHVNIVHTAFSHGFMNRYSANFTLTGYQKYLQLLASDLAVS